MLPSSFSFAKCDVDLISRRDKQKQNARPKYNVLSAGALEPCRVSGKWILREHRLGITTCLVRHGSKWPLYI